jgi:hypothetical protein
MPVQIESLATRNQPRLCAAELRGGRVVKVGTPVAIGVAIGYVLGRTRKMRWAMTLVSAGAIGRNGGPAELVKQGTKLLGSAPEVKELTENVRGRLMEAGKVAAMAAASNQINSLTDRLQERAGSPQQLLSSGADEEESEDRYADDREEERQPSARGGRGRRPRRDEEEEETEQARPPARSARRVTDEDDLGADEEREEERQPVARGGRGRRLRRDEEEEETEQARPPVRSARRVTDEDELGDDAFGRSRRSPVRRTRR